MSPADVDRIERLLHAELERTQTAYQTELKKFSSITQDIPSGIPHPDGLMRIEQAGNSYHRALADYMRALKRFNDFVVKRIVPDDLH